MDPYPIPPFQPDVAPDPAVNIITNPGAAENIDNLNILTAATVQQGQHLPPTSVPPAAHSKLKFRRKKWKKSALQFFK